MENITVYVISPAFFKTGGTELAHQLVWLYNNKGINAKIAYVDAQSYKNPINPAFCKYVKEWCAIEDIEDSKQNVIIFPEIYTEFVLNYKHAYNVIWWMSVDNYTENVYFSILKKNFGLLRAIKYTLFGRLKNRKLKRQGMQKANMHLYQSEYAREFLISLNMTNSLPLSDFINDSYFQNQIRKERQDIVLYNPKKGFRFTKNIIKRSPFLQWVPIENMSTEDVAELLSKSKVYIDFGHHPGKDRFPREAVISGCCVITGRQGSAGNDIDIPIKRKYKFEDTSGNIKSIIEMIQECLTNYEEVKADFSEYREKIMAEKDIFEKEAMELFNKIKQDI